jgi:hypothetical protein
MLARLTDPAGPPGVDAQCFPAQRSFQIVRLWDVFWLGPVMIAGGLLGEKLPPLVRATLVIAGVTTIAFNAASYTLIRRGEMGLEAWKPLQF